MAFLNETQSAAGAHGLLAAIRTYVSNLIESQKEYARFRKTYDELSTLSDRDLADLGISRSDIARVARDASKA